MTFATVILFAAEAVSEVWKICFIIEWKVWTNIVDWLSWCCKGKDLAIDT